MISNLVYRFFLMIFGRRLVTEAYVGILGREPDEIGLAAHAARVRSSGRLEPVLTEMSQAEEAWQRALNVHSEKVVRQLHEALRSGEIEPDDLAKWTAALSAATSLTGITATLSRGLGHWRRLAQNDPDALIIAAFHALMGRHPDHEGLLAYQAMVGTTGNIETFLTELAGSQEHVARVLERSRSASAIEIAGPANNEQLVTAVFKGLLGRIPDTDSMAAYAKLLADTGDLAGIVAEVGSSLEHRKRVLMKRI